MSEDTAAAVEAARGMLITWDDTLAGHRWIRRDIAEFEDAVRADERARYEALVDGWLIRLAMIALTMPGNSGMAALDLSDEIRAVIHQQGGK